MRVSAVTVHTRSGKAWTIRRDGVFDPIPMIRTAEERGYLAFHIPGFERPSGHPFSAVVEMRKVPPQDYVVPWHEIAFIVYETEPTKED